MNQPPNQPPPGVPAMAVNFTQIGPDSFSFEVVAMHLRAQLVLSRAHAEGLIKHMAGILEASSPLVVVPGAALPRNGKGLA